MDIKVSDYIKRINLSDNIRGFYEVTKDDKAGQFLYIITIGENTLPELYIKSKLSKVPLLTYLKLESSEESIKSYIENEIIGRKSQQFEFSTAIALLKAERKVTRYKWNNKNVFVYYVSPGRYDAKTDVAKSFAAEDGKVDYGAYIAIRTADGYVIPWTPTQDDLLSDDWEVIDDE